MKKILVIHPFDRSTDDLAAVWKGRDYTVVRSNRVSFASLRGEIRSHDTIVLLGHGDPGGLLRIPYGTGYIVGEKLAPLLRDKGNVFIFCYAKEFLRKHGLAGFATGMFISEPDEALTCCVKWEHGQIRQQVLLFAEILADSLSNGAPDVELAVRERFLLPNNRVADFNRFEIFGEE